MSEAFKTIGKSSEVLYKEKGSKHFGFSHEVSDISEVTPWIEIYKKNHPKANHICYAYLLSDGTEYSTDDGESKNSAGPPILGQIKSKKLTNTLVVVVRYFGGTKLGVPRLIKAYKQAASEVLDLSGRKEKIPTTIVTIQFNYQIESDVKKIIHEFDLSIVQQHYTDTIWQKLEGKKSQEELILDKFAACVGVQLLD